MQQSGSVVPAASTLPPAARKQRAQFRFTQMWESGKLPVAGDPFYEEVLPVIGMTEERFRELFEKARKATRGQSRLFLPTPTGCGRNR